VYDDGDGNDDDDDDDNNYVPKIHTYKEKKSLNIPAALNEAS